MAPKFTSMAVSTCDEYFLIGARRRHTERTSCSQIHFSNSQAASPVLFVEAPGRPVVVLFFLPSPKRGGWRAKWRNHCYCVPAAPRETAGRRSARHPDKLAQSGLICGRLPYGAGPRFSWPPQTWAASVSQAPGGQPILATRRSPGAARVRACEARPRAPHPAPPSDASR